MQLLQLRSDSPSSMGRRIGDSFDECFNFYKDLSSTTMAEEKVIFTKSLTKKGVKKFLQLP